ncbi:MAG TPA: hypothetical protein PLP74_15645 [Quisquiliibacterium sp.]|mgnify:FL=1|nr:hypothetical protein [Quisquiliibacterium sp.]HQN13553.1 hypothetical protein [Quisquiliibacterium sp.]
MWKLAVGFAIFAALAIYMLMQGGDIDLGGEKHGAEAQHMEATKSEPAKSEPAPAEAAKTDPAK